MKRYQRMTDADRAEIWDLHGKGFIPMQISKKTGRSFSTVATLIKSNGGIRPAKPTASTGRSLTLEERDVISRGLRSAETFTVIAERLGRFPSTISREVGRHGGRDGYLATTADQGARAHETTQALAARRRHPAR